MKVLKSYRNSVITSMFIVMTIEWLEQLKKSSTLKMFMLFQVIQIRIKQLKREIGRQAGQLLESILYEDAIVSVTEDPRWHT